MKKEEIIKAIIYSAAFIICVALWSYRSNQREISRFQMRIGLGETGMPFLVDSQTGAVWRYYITNFESEYDLLRGKGTEEGFKRLRGPMNEE